MPIWGERFAERVARYLATERGRDTPEVVARRLLALEPATIGLEEQPSGDELHLVRMTLERIAERRGELPTAEVTVTRLRPLALCRDLADSSVQPARPPHSAR